MKAQIIVDLGFGDSGKGITTDYLCYKAGNPLVIRYSGGQNAGHTVMLEDKKHVHASFGSGTLRGIPSYFSEHCSIYLNTMFEEMKILLEKGVTPKLFVHPLAKLTTPYDVAYNRATEKLLGHGSCGLGIGSTMKRHNMGYRLYAQDLKYPNILKAKLEQIRNYYEKLFIGSLSIGLRLHLEEANFQMQVFEELINQPLMFTITDYNLLSYYHNLIFEGSQGILLDKDHGFFPNVTYANTTSKNAFEVLDKLVSQTFSNIATEIYYVTRCYQTRHGAGWMSNETPITLVGNEDEINIPNEWQKNFRIGKIDYDLLNYALDIDKNYSKDIAKNLVVTCLDQRPDFEFEHMKLNTGFQKVLESSSPYSKYMRER